MKSLLASLSTGAASLALLLATPALADEPVAVAEAAAAPAAAASVARPALWKVADEDTTIYLFGTVHILPDGIAWADGAVGEALAASDTLVTEIPSGPEADAQMQQLVMAQGMLPQGTTLRTLLDDEQKATYEAAMSKIGMPPAAFDQFEPWMAGLTLTILPLMQQGYQLDAGVEEGLIKLAGADKPRAALETIEFQMSLFDGMPQPAQIEFLVAASKGVEQVKPMLDSMVAEWAEGDAEGLAAVMNAEMSDPAVAEALLYSRNANWAEWIDTRLDAPGTVFMAVGAGHLAGERSVQDLLAQRGIATARVQ